MTEEIAEKKAETGSAVPPKKEETGLQKAMKTPEYWENVGRQNDAFRLSIELMEYGGGKCYCVLVPKSMSWTGEIYIHADTVKVADGALEFWRTHDYDVGDYCKGPGGVLEFTYKGRRFSSRPLDEPILHTALAAGTWQAFHAPSNGIRSWPGLYRFNGTDDPDPAQCWADVPLGEPVVSATKDGKTKRKPISDGLRFRVLERSGFKCAYCGRSSKEAGLEIEHITPVAKGGTNHIENLQAACRRCNSGKSDRELTI